MPLHFLDFFGLDHHHHLDAGSVHHDDLQLHYADNVHVHDHSNIHHGHRATNAAFLSSSETHPHALSGNSADALLTQSLTGASKLSLTTRQASAFLDSGLTGIATSHSSTTSFLQAAAGVEKSLQMRLTETIQSAPPYVLVPLHALSIVGAVPGHVAFELGEGFLFGFQKGFALALTGKFLGSAAAFTIGRSAVSCACVKDRVLEQMNKWPLCKKVARGIENGGGGSVFVLRMAPVPCIVKNYSLAILTDIPYSTYLTFSLAGLIPTTLAHVYAGTLAPSAMALANGTSHMSGVQAACLASPVVAGVLMTMYAGYYLRQHVLTEDEENEKDDINIDIDVDKIKDVKFD